jgi:HAD superfamily hydrolase (TIGR01484 family)
MRPLAEMPDSVASDVALVFTDIDDTMTHRGRLPAAAYRALEDLYNAGFVVAPITGRPAGWCDMIARFWPVAGVIGENGAMYFAYDGLKRRMRRVYSAGAQTRAANRRRLGEIEKRVLAEVPGAAVSADQAYREADLAIDFCEDVTPLSQTAIAQIKSIFESMGAQAKVSSIHVNGWFGEYDKLSMARRFAAEIADIDIDAQRERILFVGDSPNDAPMFGFFPNACGVADILRFRDDLEAEPAYICAGGGGDGFVEVAERLLSVRKRART